jgi:hypothetical protein
VESKGACVIRRVLDDLGWWMRSGWAAKTFALNVALENRDFMFVQVVDPMLRWTKPYELP